MSKTKLYLLPKMMILLVIITLSAWGVMLYMQWQMTSLPITEMWIPPDSAGQWEISDFTTVYAMWAVMMAAMMLPTALPMIKVFSRTCQKKYSTDQPYTLIFSFAYLLIWFLFSIILTLLQWQLHSHLLLTRMMENNSIALAALIFITAGIYQFTAQKNACLHHCRSPLGFLLHFWQQGKYGAFKMGIIHGKKCLGCCWAQMLIMFAVGVMNIMAMALITLFILLEKTLPTNENFFSTITGIFLCLWGIELLYLYFILHTAR